ncbi:complement C1q-like protein 2 [Pungitius pungitius]|uniref:complement C1q-like protein 2 n=1 Tax=Pungitius pungitius TaxID=134920 RepID=UPI002E13FD03
MICLLHGALPYGWVDPGVTPPADLPGSGCITDRGSCGCCLMLREVNRMSTYFNATLNALEKDYAQAKRSVEKIEASRGAFSVALTDQPYFFCFGPFTSEKLVTYQHVFINLGGGYDPGTGVFTAAQSGVYSLALTVFGDAGAPGVPLAACADLLVNGRAVAGARERNAQDQEDSASTVLALHLNAGDKVAVSLPVGCSLCGDVGHFNTFSAFLLYPTE